MPVHNGMPYLPQAVESILGQTLRDFEFVIVDDASTDDTAAYLAGLHDDRVRVIHNQENLGVASSLNKAIGAARGEYLARQDADDVSLPRRLEAQLSYLDRHPEIAVLGTPATYIDGSGNAVGIWTVPSAGIDIKWRLLFDNCHCIIHTSAMIRASALRACDGYPQDAGCSLAEDYALWCRIGRGHGLANLEERLVNFRSHGASVSDRRQDEQREQVRRIALANVGWTMDGRSVPGQDYECVRQLLLSSASFKPEFSATTLRSAVRFLRQLQQAFYARHGFGTQTVLMHRRSQWTWGKHLVALSVRGRFDLLSRVSSALLGAHLLSGSLAASLQLCLGRTSEAAKSREPNRGPLGGGYFHVQAGRVAVNRED